VNFQHSSSSHQILPNGIQLPKNWPPRYNITQIAGQMLAHRPYVIRHDPMNISYTFLDAKRQIGSRGRWVGPGGASHNMVLPLRLGIPQLFWDDFLVEHRAGVEFRVHDMMVSDTQIIRHTAGFNPWVGGVVTTTIGANSSRSRLYYSCPREGDVTRGALYAAAASLCLVESSDFGRSWGDTARATMPFFDDVSPYDDYTLERFSVRKVADPPLVTSGLSPGPYFLGAVTTTLTRDENGRSPRGPFVILHSGDGLHWKLLRKLGHTLDATANTYDPWRRKWVFYLKDNFNYWVRTVRHYEMTDIRVDPSWADYISRCAAPFESLGFNASAFGACSKPESALGFFHSAADTADPRYRSIDLAEGLRETDLYFFDSQLYRDSIHLGVRAIHTGGQGMIKYIDPYITYSRDGFHFGRPGAGSKIPALSRQSYEEFCCSATSIADVKSGQVRIYCRAMDIKVGNLAAPDVLANIEHGTPLTVDARDLYRVIELTVRLDGYTGLLARGVTGRIVTKPFASPALAASIPPNSSFILTVNAKCLPRTGEVRVLLEPVPQAATGTDSNRNDHAVPMSSPSNANPHCPGLFPITGDSVAHRVDFSPACLEKFIFNAPAFRVTFELRKCEIFSFMPEVVQI
jgi:hypothetical protein